MELMIAVTLIGILVAMAIPMFQKVKQNSQATAFKNDLRAAAGALDTYAMEKGSYPPDGGGSWPTVMLDYLPPPDRWTQATPIGGQWVWARASEGVSASIQIRNYIIQAGQIQAIDKALDDGSPTTGLFLSSGTTAIYVIDP